MADSLQVTIDWCEENYAVTPYIAEFWNTVTAFVTMLPAIVWLFQPNPQGTQWCRLLHLNVVVIQIGSTVFHGTLTWFGQLLDEIPILLWCCASICLTLDTFTIRSSKNFSSSSPSVSNAKSTDDDTRDRKDKAGVNDTLRKRVGDTLLAEHEKQDAGGQDADNKTKTLLGTRNEQGTDTTIVHRVWWAPGPFCLSVFGSVQVILTTYLYIFHAKFYKTFLSVVLVQAGLHWPLILTELFYSKRVDRIWSFRGMSVTMLCEDLKGKAKDNGERGGGEQWQHVRSHSGVLSRLLARHVLTGYGGFLLWIVDNTFCEYVRIFQLHAWWHVLAIVSLKYWHDFLVYYRLCVLPRPGKQIPVYRPCVFGLGRSVFLEEETQGIRAE
eukprot:TRINITY_DN51339_c0_g1_i1.p1 TRINITY_DN51339_c0_g1~~TRINITY_DN51339_c0_g1_i1.p1  ORF type:complete len:382 (+),score=31.51 TRINITY_DN51339_c0_g1_i1:21-1166(+)